MFRGQIPEGVDPRTLDAGRAAAARVPGPRRAPRGDGRAGPRSGAACSRRSRAASSRRCATTSRRRWPRCRAFNRWLDEDWGFSYQDRIIAAPMLSLADPDGALAELDWLLERGARIVHLRPAPVPTANGRGRSFGDPAARPGLGPPRRGVGPGRVPPRRQRLRGVRRRVGRARTTSSRSAAVDVLVEAGRVGPARSTTRSAAWSSHGVFDRHPDAPRREHRERLRLGAPAGEAAAEAGEPDAVGVPARARSRRSAQHVWVTPYYEEDLRKLADLIGVERVLFGSDWPHGEGLAQPDRLRQGAPRVLRRRDPPGHARQLPGAAAARSGRRDRHRRRSESTTTTALLADVVDVARRRTGIPTSPSPSGGSGSAPRGGSAPHFPVEWGGRGYHRRVGRRDVRHGVPDVTARCCRRAGSGCSWPRPRSCTPRDPGADRPARAADLRRLRSRGASCSASRARAPTSPGSRPARRATATTG